VHLDGFIIRKFVTVHGHVNVKVNGILETGAEEVVKHPFNETLRLLQIIIAHSFNPELCQQINVTQALHDRLRPTMKQRNLLLRNSEIMCKNKRNVKYCIG
jgi:hypothetical protein